MVSSGGVRLSSLHLSVKGASLLCSGNSTIGSCSIFPKMDRLPNLLTPSEITFADVLYNDGELNPDKFPIDDERLVKLVRYKIEKIRGGKFHHPSVVHAPRGVSTSNSLTICLSESLYAR